MVFQPRNNDQNYSEPQSFVHRTEQTFERINSSLNVEHQMLLQRAATQNSQRYQQNSVSEDGDEIRTRNSAIREDAGTGFATERLETVGRDKFNSWRLKQPSKIQNQFVICKKNFALI